MSEYNKVCEGVFTSTGTSKFISLPALPNSFEMWNVTAMGTPTQNEITHALSWRDSTAGTASVEYFNATPVLTTTNLASGGITFLEAGTYQYGAVKTISSVTQASPAVVNCTSHGFQTGDAVLIYGTTGMLQIAGQVYTVTRINANSFSIPVDSSGFAAGASAGFCKQVLYPDLYVPFGVGITAISTGATTTITTAQNHGFVLGQEVFFVIPQVSASAWGTTQLDSAAYVTSLGVPQQAYVTAIGAANQFTVNVNSSSYTAFAFPTSAQASLGMTFPQVLAVGDQNTGYSGIYPLPVQPTQQTYTNTLYPKAITIPGAYLPNTRSGVLVGLGNGTQLLQQTNDVIRWRAIYPDQIQTS